MDGSVLTACLPAIIWGSFPFVILSPPIPFSLWYDNSAADRRAFCCHTATHPFTGNLRCYWLSIKVEESFCGIIESTNLRGWKHIFLSKLSQNGTLEMVLWSYLSCRQTHPQIPAKVMDDIQLWWIGRKTLLRSASVATLAQSQSSIPVARSWVFKQVEHWISDGWILI